MIPGSLAANTVCGGGRLLSVRPQPVYMEALVASTRTRGRRSTEFRAELKAEWKAVNKACGICGQATIHWDGDANQPESFELHHLRDPEHYPHLEFDLSNVVPSHSRCNRSAGRGGTVRGIGETSEVW